MSVNCGVISTSRKILYEFCDKWVVNWTFLTEEEEGEGEEGEGEEDEEDEEAEDA